MEIEKFIKSLARKAKLGGRYKMCIRDRGYTTYDALNDFALLESAVREDLNARATRVSAVLNLSLIHI